MSALFPAVLRRMIGGLAQFGFPLSEAFAERLEDWRDHIVQYFERGRLEDHPENAAPDDVLLGQFGRVILTQVDALGVDPALFALYTAVAAVRDGLGALVEGPTAVPGATRVFEHGLLLYRGDRRCIYGMCQLPGKATGEL